MEYETRESLINSLREAMGPLVTEKADSANKFFDAGTGTLYLNSAEIEKPFAMETLNYLKGELAKQMNNSVVSQYYEVAISCIVKQFGLQI